MESEQLTVKVGRVQHFQKFSNIIYLPNSVKAKVNELQVFVGLQGLADRHGSRNINVLCMRTTTTQQC